MQRLSAVPWLGDRARELKLALISLTPGQRRQRRAALAFYRRFVPRGGLCFDVGANVGARTELFLELGARVVCVEPQSYCVGVLRRRFGRNPNVTIVPKGAADRVGVAELALCAGAPSLATLSPHRRAAGRFAARPGWGRTEEVALTTLDELIGAYGVPDFCKIDVEGFEPSVLRGLSRPVGALAYEFTREGLDETVDCAERLGSIGMTRFNFTVGDVWGMLAPTWLSVESLGEALREAVATSADPLFWGDIYALPNRAEAENVPIDAPRPPC